jgi:hypothetical protein
MVPSAALCQVVELAVLHSRHEGAWKGSGAADIAKELAVHPRRTRTPWRKPPGWIRGRSGGMRPASGSPCSLRPWAIAAALRVPLTELAWLPTEPAARSDQTLPRGSCACRARRRGGSPYGGTQLLGLASLRRSRPTSPTVRPRPDRNRPPRCPPMNLRQIGFPPSAHSVLLHRLERGRTPTTDTRSLGPGQAATSGSRIGWADLNLHSPAPRELTPRDAATSRLSISR